MALVVLGNVVGQVSGRVGGSVYAKNRAGVYMRNGTKPVNTITPYRSTVRGNLTSASQHWKTLTYADQEAWNTWAAQIAWKNRLGQTISLTGQQACVQCNARILLAGGAMIDIPALDAPPENVTGVTLTGDIGSGTFTFAWTSGALPAGCHLYFRGCVLESTGRRYTKNLLRGFLTTAAAATTPTALKSAAETRFGTFQVGQIFICEYSVIDDVTGLVSSVYMTQVFITDTP